MFQISVAIVSITLAVFVAVAGLFYGGDIYSNSSIRIEYARYKNESSQIETALRLFRVDKGAYPMDESVGGGTSPIEKVQAEKYLTAIPHGNWRLVDGYVIRPLNDLVHCRNMNNAGGYGEICPICGSVADHDIPACTCTASSAPYCTP